MEHTAASSMSVSSSVSAVAKSSKSNFFNPPPPTFSHAARTQIP